MHSLTNLSTQELTRTRLRLNTGLRFVPVVRNGVNLYRLEDPERSRYFEVGYAEYLFISYLDGSTTFAAAMTLAARKLGSQSVTEDEAIQVGIWLVDNQLADAVNTSGRVHTGSEARPVRRTGAGNTLFSWKIPLGNPDRVLRALLPVIGWACSPAAFWSLMVLWLVALIVLGSHWESLQIAAGPVFSQSNWLSLLLAWLGLKLIHELGHAITCRYHGGAVPEAGVCISMLTPMAYVDVTSSWALSARWKRMHVAAAGMLFELTVAAIAILFWPILRDEFLKHQVVNLVLMATLTTLVFNLNSLMRFDGYYLLSDLLGIPGLANQANRAWMAIAKKCMFGDRAQLHLPCGWRKAVIYVYGLAAMAWKVVVLATLTVAGSVMLRGGGIALVALGVGLWFLPFLRRATHEIADRWRESPRIAARGMTVFFGTSAAAVAMLMLIPSPCLTSAPAVVDYSHASILRATTPGFIQSIPVHDGQTVTAGEILAILRNDDLETEYADLQLELMQSDLRRVMSLQRREIGEAQAELRNYEALLVRFKEVARRKEALTLRAPIDGRVVARRLENRLGSYLKEGDELMTIGNERRKEVLISIAQTDLALFSKAVSSGRLIVPGQVEIPASPLPGTPRATTGLPHPAFSATSGGPLAVQEAERNGRTTVELMEPRFVMRYEIPEQAAQRIPAGRMGMLTVDAARLSLWHDARTRVSRWVRDIRARST